MGQIVFGMGSSHSPQLSTPAGLWPIYGEGDRNNPGLMDNAGIPRTYDELLEMAPASISEQLTPEIILKRHNSNQASIARLSEAQAAANLDALIILGDDQEEMHLDDNRPAIMVYWGDELVNGGVKVSDNTPEFRKAAAWDGSIPTAIPPIQ
jgi:3-O-methylgallate 3,4-dioxygenase